MRGESLPTVSLQILQDHIYQKADANSVPRDEDGVRNAAKVFKKIFRREKIGVVAAMGLRRMIIPGDDENEAGKEQKGRKGVRVNLRTTNC